MVKSAVNTQKKFVQPLCMLAHLNVIPIQICLINKKKFKNLKIAEWLDISFSNLFRSQFLAHTPLVCACGREDSESSLKEIRPRLLLLDLVVN